jgi:hypothetical protein
MRTRRLAGGGGLASAAYDVGSTEGAGLDRPTALKETAPRSGAEYMRAWREANPERVWEYRRRWRERHPDRVKAYNEARRTPLSRLLCVECGAAFKGRKDRRVC